MKKQSKRAEDLRDLYEDIGSMNEEFTLDFGPNTKFFDVFSMHNLLELYAISRLCYFHDPKCIVEYGTALGGLTRLFGRWSYVAGAKVLTVEDATYSALTHHPQVCEDIMNNLPITFYKGNEYKQETYDTVQRFVSDKKTLFYCDGGNKLQELKWCANIMDGQDLLLTHDYDMSKEEIDSITLPPLLAEVAHIRKEQVQQIISDFSLKVVFEKQLGRRDGCDRRLTHILALQKKE